MPSSIPRTGQATTKRTGWRAYALQSVAPFDKRILVYVWDEAGLIGRILPNPWLPDKERMLVLETAASPTEVWVDESVDLGRDFARAFPGESPGELEALAFIADTDNTRSRVSAGLDDLKIQCEPRARVAR